MPTGKESGPVTRERRRDSGEQIIDVLLLPAQVCFLSHPGGSSSLLLPTQLDKPFYKPVALVLRRVLPGELSVRRGGVHR